jgi:hypothetical protein
MTYTFSGNGFADYFKMKYVGKYLNSEGRLISIGVTPMSEFELC